MCINAIKLFAAVALFDGDKATYDGGAGRYNAESLLERALTGAVSAIFDAEGSEVMQSLNWR